MFGKHSSPEAHFPRCGSARPQTRHAQLLALTFSPGTTGPRQGLSRDPGVREDMVPWRSGLNRLTPFLLLFRASLQLLFLRCASALCPGASGRAALTSSPIKLVTTYMVPVHSVPQCLSHRYMQKKSQVFSKSGENPELLVCSLSQEHLALWFVPNFWWGTQSSLCTWPKKGFKAWSIVHCMLP